MRGGQDGQSITGLVASGTAFHLLGGIYAFNAIVHSHSGLTANFAVLGPDGTTYQNLLTNLTGNYANPATAPLYLGPGRYQFVVSGSAGGGESWDFQLVRVPGE